MYRALYHLNMGAMSEFVSETATAAAATAKHLTKDVAKRFGKAAKAFAAAHATVGVHTGVAILVISSAFLAVREHLVGFFALFELFLGHLGLVALVAVGVVLHGQLAVGRFDFDFRGRAGDA